MSEATIPIVVDPEAAARIAGLGFQQHVDRMVEYARRSVPEITQIEILMNYRYDEEGTEDGVAIDVRSARPDDANRSIHRGMVRWVTSTFPPEVLEHLHLSYYFG
jgi:hypothetical protein